MLVEGEGERGVGGEEEDVGEEEEAEEGGRHGFGK